jgi:hypothetical protein
MSSAPRPLSGEAAEHAARVARLPLSPERLQIVGPIAELAYTLIDLMDAVPLGETPPATAFDPRWDR